MRPIVIGLLLTVVALGLSTAVAQSPSWRPPTDSQRTLPSAIKQRAREVREAAQILTKRSQELSDRSDVLIREAETRLFESQRALRRAMSRSKTSWATSSVLLRPPTPSAPSGCRSAVFPALERRPQISGGVTIVISQVLVTLTRPSVS
jgi:hypothetical protein